MREIKFRAWNGKQMLEWHWITAMGYEQRILENNNYIPMQFTSLHDKNGKEIWEGDIISYDVYSVDWMLHKIKTKLGIVRWFEDRAGFQSQEIKENYWGGYYRESFDFCEDIEVIGNIYENPELLKGEK